MRFAHPELLALAGLLIPALGVFLIWAWRRKQKLVSQFVQSRLLAHLTVGVSQARQKLRLVLLFFAATFALLALARPQWGFSWEETTVQGLDIIVAIDTSKSMLAEDISPNRLARAKLAAYDLVNIAKSDRFGLIAFAGTAFLQCPLTLDEQAFRQSVESLDVNIIPQGGTAVSEAISTAIEAFEKSENHKVLILFTDGEDHDEDAIAAAEKAAKADLKLFTIGVGTREGELLRIRDERGNQVFLKDDQGNAVKSRLNENLLQQIATKGNGFYLPLIGTTAMEALYNKGLASLPRGNESTSKLVKNYRERYYWPLGLSIVLLILEMFLPQQRRAKRGEQGANTSNLKKVAASVCLILLPLAALASPTSAQKKYEAGKFDEAFAEYQKLLAKKTNDLRLHYNAGDAAYQSKEFDIARKHFENATVAPDLELQQKAYYNLGNTLYQIGEPVADPKEKQEAWEQAIKNYDNALKLNPKDVDANNNMAFVKQRLEELKQQQQQQQKQDQSKDDKKDDKKDQDQQKKDGGKNDQAKQDQEQQQQNSDQQKQDQQNQQKQDQAQKDKEQQQKEKEQQQAQNKEGKEDEKKDGQSGKPGEEKDAEEQEGEMAAADGKMTEGQAQQFLEALKREEKPLIFRPPPKERKNPNQPFKDW